MSDAHAIAGELLARAGIAASRFSVIELPRPGAEGGRVALLLFLDGQPTPTLFVKLARGELAKQQLRCEFENLQLLESHGTTRLARSVPRPVHLGESGAYTVMAETAVQGVRMKNYPPGDYFGSAEFARHLGRTVDWLREFHRSLSPAEPLLTVRPPFPADVVERFRERVARSAELDMLMSETAGYLTRDGHRLSRSPWHGDFCTANLLVAARDRLHVVDWEYPLGLSWPLADLLYFLASIWCVPYAKGAAALRANFERLFFERSTARRLFADSAAWYLTELAIPHEALLPLSVYAWIAYANRKLDELAAERAEEVPPTVLADHAPLTLFEDGHCLNLELLAERRERYVLTAL